MSSFAQTLETGRIAEGLIAQWLISRGAAVMPAYEIEQSHGKGPQLFTPSADLVAPDMLAFTHKGIKWIEAKHKSVWTWHRKTKQWTTGIDLRHYGDYMRVAKQTQIPVWLLFFHRETAPDPRDVEAGCPECCPTGLFGGELFSLVVSENHRSLPYDPSRAGFVGHGKSGMVYWSHSALKQFAKREEVYQASKSLT